jgi:enolase
MSAIKKVIGREVLDSRGNPTVEVELWTAKNKVRASVPSGASTGSYEAVELRDKGARYAGKGVLKAVSNVNILGKKLVGKRLDQHAIDEFLIKEDGTKDKSRYGANAILGISLAATKALAAEHNEPLYKTFGKIAHNKRFILPRPMFNIINGGMHAGNHLDFQEYMVIPEGKSFAERLRIGTEIYHQLKKDLAKSFGKHAVNVGDEGGFAPPMSIVEDPIDFILSAAKELGYEKKIGIGLDAAATNLKVGDDYILERKKHDAFAMIDVYKELAATYPIISIEDPFAEDDWENFYVLTKEIGKKVQIVGDDLLVTNKKRIEAAIKLHSCNALLLKMNQIGTVSEAISAGTLAMKHKWNVIVSHRSGETEDTSIADLSVGLGCGQIKAGAPARSERTAKYNQLLRIEEQLRK